MRNVGPASRLLPTGEFPGVLVGFAVAFRIPLGGGGERVVIPGVQRRDGCGRAYVIAGNTEIVKRLVGHGGLGSRNSWLVGNSRCDIWRGNRSGNRLVLAPQLRDDRPELIARHEHLAGLRRRQLELLSPLGVWEPHGPPARSMTAATLVGLRLVPARDIRVLAVTDPEMMTITCKFDTQEENANG